MKFYWKLGYLFRFSKIGNHVYNIYSLIVIYITGYVDFFSKYFYHSWIWFFQALDFITRHAADFKLKRLKKLAVSGAFHSQLMAPAVQVLKKALMKIPVHDPVIPVHSNVDGKRYKNSKHIISQLPKQIVSPVRWEQTMHIIYERNNEQEFPLTYECGPGRSLSAILRKVNAKAAKSCTSIDVWKYKFVLVLPLSFSSFFLFLDCRIEISNLQI